MSVATVLYCSRGQSAAGADSVVKLRIHAGTSFEEVLEAATHCLGVDPAAFELVDDHGAYWPLATFVVAELRRSVDTCIRLRPRDESELESESEVASEAKPEEEERQEDPQVRSARPPKRYELLMHSFFFAVICADSYVGHTAHTSTCSATRCSSSRRWAAPS